MALTAKLYGVLLKVECRNCGNAIERLGSSLAPVKTLKCDHCKQESRFTYPDKVELWKRYGQ